MRIVAGSRKGATILAPKGRATRPTSDRVRESIFALTGPVEGLRVLDLYAGSGTLGLEALSRGAVEATFVERDHAAAALISRNLERLRLAEGRVVRAEVARALAADAAAGKQYDLVLIDPPYAMLERLLPTLADRLPAVLAAEALVVLESDARQEPELPLVTLTTRRYGGTRVTLFRQSQVRP